MNGITAFFELASNIKNYCESEIEDSPEDYKNSYGDIGKIVGGIKFTDWSIKSSEMQILKFENEKKYSYLVKRIVIPCTITKEELFSSPIIKDFIIKGLSEYVISKMVAGHPYGINSQDFMLVRLPSQSLLIMEFLMEDAGNTIKKGYISILKNPQLAMSILSQSANVLAFLEFIKCPFHDITMDNFVIDKKGNLRLISFEIGQIAKNYIAIKMNNQNEFIAYTEGYVSPEIYTIAIGIQGLALSKLDMNMKEAHNKESSLPSMDHFDIWSSNIYAWGMIALLLLGVIPDLNTFKLMDKKKNEKENKDISLLINSLNSNETLNVNCTEAMKLILRSCLEYEPSRRVPFGFVNQVLSNILSNPNKINFEAIKNSLEEAINKKGPINTNNENLNKQNLVYQQKVKELHNDNMNLRLQLEENQNKFKEFDIYIRQRAAELQQKDQQINKLNYINSNLSNQIKDYQGNLEQYKMGIVNLNSSMSTINSEKEKLVTLINNIIKVLIQKCNYKFVNNENLIKDLETIIEKIPINASSNNNFNQNINSAEIILSINACLNSLRNKENLEKEQEGVSLKMISNINQIPEVIDQITKRIKNLELNYTQSKNFIENRYPEIAMSEIEIVKSKSPSSSSVLYSQNQSNQKKNQRSEKQKDSKKEKKKK